MPPRRLVISEATKSIGGVGSDLELVITTIAIDISSSSRRPDGVQHEVIVARASFSLEEFHTTVSDGRNGHQPTGTGEGGSGEDVVVSDGLTLIEEVRPDLPPPLPCTLSRPRGHPAYW